MRNKENRSSSTDTTSANKANPHHKQVSKPSSSSHVGQGELYSPAYAIRVNTGGGGGGREAAAREGGENMGVVEEIRRHVGGIKERILDKLAAANSVPADALENARHFLETVVKDVTVAAHGLTKDALNRIKTHLVDILPSLSPSITRKMVDDAAKETNSEGVGSEGEDREMENEEKQSQSKAPYASPASSFFASLRPTARL